MRAFVIDDSKPVRSILTKMLQTMDFETTEAQDGQQALDYLAQRSKPDVFLVNWNMPLLNGLEFIRSIKANAEYTDIPLLVVSAETRDATKAQASRAGARGFLEKPVTLATLRNALIELGVHPSVHVSQPKDPDPTRPTTMSGNHRERTLGRSPNADTQIKKTSSGRTRVLVVDDSVVVRGIVSKMLQQDDDLEVVNTAADGVIALAKLKQHEVDVILLDIEMPRMNGLEVLKQLKEDRNRTPVVMFSSLTGRGASATIEALMLGAKDYVMKPGGAYMTDAQEGKRAILEELIPKLKQAAIRKTLPLAATREKPVQRGSEATPQRKKLDAVVIGVSTGGPQALAKLIPKLGGDFPVPVIILQHMPAAFTKHLSDRLTTECGFSVKEAEHAQSLQAGDFVVAPGGVHLAVKRFASKVVVALNDGPAVNACKPSADVLFKSAASAYAGNVLGVILTGMGSDGTDGSREIKQAGGNVIVQDEESSVVWGMPGSVVRAGQADKVVPIDALASEILNRVWKYRRKTPPTYVLQGRDATP